MNRNKVCKCSAARGKWLTFIGKEESLKIPQWEILLIEQRARKLKIVTERGIFRPYGKMKECFERLDGDFCPCHTYFVINMKKVTRMSKGSIIFENGHEAFLGKGSFARTRRQFDIYLRSIDQSSRADV